MPLYLIIEFRKHYELLVNQRNWILNLFNNIQIRYKLWLIIGLMSVGTGALIVISLYSLYTIQLKDRQTGSQELVDVAHSMMQHFYDKTQTDGISEEEAKHQALQAMRALKYSETEYFWVNDMNSIMLVHPAQPKLEGSNLSNFRDENGAKVFEEFVTLANTKGEGHVDYLWPRTDSTIPSAKNAYIKLFKPWKFVIGSGIYLDDLKQDFINNLVIFITAVALLTLVVGGAALLIIHLVTLRITQLKEIMADVEQSGDLSHRINLSGKDELGIMSNAFNSMMLSFQTIVNKVSSSSVQLDAIVERANQIGEKTVRGVLEQKKEIQQTASAMLEMAASSQQTNELANETNLRAHEVQQQSNQGLKIINNTNASIHSLAQDVSNATQSIHELRGFVGEIELILEVISNVSEQTNLLALNAAIEAARAGEQGRGFAVVADEVRQLAHRSQSSAVEINNIINNLRDKTLTTVDIMEIVQSKASDGVEQTQLAEQSFVDIASGVEDIYSLNQQITQATNEQSQVAEEISQSISKINDVTDNTEDNSKSMENSIVDLQQCAQQLRGLIQAFST